jgi:hypothetical protein
MNLQVKPDAFDTDFEASKRSSRPMTRRGENAQ